MRLEARWNVDSFSRLLYRSTIPLSLSLSFTFFFCLTILKENLIYTMSASCQRIGTFIYYSISQAQMCSNSFHGITFCKFASIHSNSFKMRRNSICVMNADTHVRNTFISVCECFALLIIQIKLNWSSFTIFFSLSLIDEWAMCGARVTRMITFCGHYSVVN